jgi:hypothetical protein
MQVLKATPRPCEEADINQQWRFSNSLTSAGSTLNSIYQNYVLGDSLGRFELLRMLSGRIIRAEIAVWASRMQLWGSQLGIGAEIDVSSCDLEQMCECGMWVDEGALEMMSSGQLREVLLNAELAALHDNVHLAQPV